MDIYFLTLKYIEWETHQIFSVPDVKNQKSITSILYRFAICRKLLREIIHLNFCFKISFKISLNLIITEASSPCSGAVKNSTHPFRSVYQTYFFSDVGMLIMIMDLIILMKSLTLTVNLSLTSTSSETLLLNVD